MFNSPNEPENAFLKVIQDVSDAGSSIDSIYRDTILGYVAFVNACSILVSPVVPKLIELIELAVSAKRVTTPELFLK
jgi:hypothetical protein